MEVLAVLGFQFCIIGCIFFNPQQTTDNRQQTTDNPQQTTDNRQPTTENSTENRK